MNAREPAGSEEVRFEDLDLVYIISFDLGASIEAEDLKKLLEWFSKRCKTVEGIWIPPEEARPTPEFVYRKAKELGIKDPEKIGIEELMKNERLKEEINRALAMFGLIVLANRVGCLPGYLELGRYVRLKLTNLNIGMEDLGFNRLKCELYLLLHDAGVGIITAWIHLDGSLSTDDAIKIQKELYEAKCRIKDPFGNIVGGTLFGFIEENIVKPLHVAIMFKNKYGNYDEAIKALKKGDITEDKIREKIRTTHCPIRPVVCIRKHRCHDGCTTAEDAVKRHSREIAGILAENEGWRGYRMDAVKKHLENSPSLYESFAMFVIIGASLFMGSTKLDEWVKGVESKEDQELKYRSAELFLVIPTEFLALSDMILDAYTSVYRNKRDEFKERRRRGETVRPSEVMGIRDELTDGLEEYNNISVFRVDPFRGVMEYGKERLMLSKKVDILLSGLQELSDMARTFYEEEALKKQVELAARQEDLSRKQVLLTILFGVFGAFQALEYLEPKLGFLPAFAVTLTIFTLIYLCYKLYIRGKLHLFRRKKAG
jgi:hypothetical protein